jgi:hypothetical protein
MDEVAEHVAGAEGVGAFVRVQPRVVETLEPGLEDGRRPFEHLNAFFELQSFSLRSAHERHAVQSTVAPNARLPRPNYDPDNARAGWALRVRSTNAMTRALHVKVTHQHTASSRTRGIGSCSAFHGR